MPTPTRKNWLMPRKFQKGPLVLSNEAELF
jgi:hypothetical protein